MADDPLDLYGAASTAADPLDAYARPEQKRESSTLSRLGHALWNMAGSAVSGDFLNPSRADYSWVPPPVSNYVDRTVGSAADSFAHMASHPEDIIGAGNLAGMARPRLQWTPEMQAAAREGYVTARQNLQSVADRVGVSAGALRDWLMSQGITIRAAAPQRTDLPLDQIRRLYAPGGSGREGMTQPELARRYGTSISVISDRLAGLGLGRTSPFANIRDTAVVDRVEALRRSGLSYGEIARQMSLSRSQVAGMIRDLRASGKAIPAVLLALLAGADGMSGDSQ